MTYTLDDLERLARQYVVTSPLTDKLIPELILSSFLFWLRREATPTNDNLLQFNLVKEVGDGGQAKV